MLQHELRNGGCVCGLWCIAALDDSHHRLWSSYHVHSPKQCNRQVQNRRSIRCIRRFIRFVSICITFLLVHFGGGSWGLITTCFLRDDGILPAIFTNDHIGHAFLVGTTNSGDIMILQGISTSTSVLRWRFTMQDFSPDFYVSVFNFDPRLSRS